MAIYELKNEKIAIQIDTLGAEIKSLKNCNTDAEYMWSGDAAYWGRVSPVLFPFVGGVFQKEYRTKGKTYSMSQHGFARDMEFELLTKESEFIEFQLKSTPETLEKYPYEFVLKIGYQLVENTVKVIWKVENPAAEEMYFAIGGHPGFRCPLNEKEKPTDCSIRFDAGEKLVCTEINERGMAIEQKTTYALADGMLPITKTLFDKDALVVEHEQAKTVSLCDASGKPYLTVRMEAPLFGIWSPPKMDAPFVCIEPWYGRCDCDGYQGELKDREWENTLAPGNVWSASYEIVVE